MTIRERTEEKERRMLGPRAALSSQSRGRERSEEPDAIRTAFARDRDRVLHCKSFRRLKHKTQVFLATENDHYRTRLTHTLEVSQIARTVARALELNEDLTEAIALGHDLGHTPFGHAGERALDGALRAHDSCARFRHFEQSLRVVEVLENQGAGLNLTWETRDGIGNHSKGRADIGAPGGPATLEGQCVRVADRIAYIHHDIEDAVRAGLLAQNDLPADVLAGLGGDPRQRLTTLVTDVVETSENEPSIALSAPVAALLDTLKEFLFDRVYTHEREKMAGLDVDGIVAALFNDALTRPESLPDWLLAVAQREHADAGRAAVQTAVDYVAGMTDRFALRAYESLS
ncbi:MAG TPA: deoxyguanosinetriphosphate triphosphohydrolase [Armatimonadota bacterium]|jgi:dGTPase